MSELQGIGYSRTGTQLTEIIDDILRPLSELEDLYYEGEIKTFGKYGKIRINQDNISEALLPFIAIAAENSADPEIVCFCANKILAYTDSLEDKDVSNSEKSSLYYLAMTTALRADELDSSEQFMYVVMGILSQSQFRLGLYSKEKEKYLKLAIPAAYRLYKDGYDDFLELLGRTKHQLAILLPQKKQEALLEVAIADLELSVSEGYDSSLLYLGFAYEDAYINSYDVKKRESYRQSAIDTYKQSYEKIPENDLLKRIRNLEQFTPNDLEDDEGDEETLI